MLRAVLLDEKGLFVSDAPFVDLASPPLNWTTDLPDKPYFKAAYSGLRGESGRWAGGSWREVGGPPTLSSQEKQRDNNTAYTAATRALTADYPQLEKDTWPTQDQEAAAWVADPDAATTPWVDLAALERGIKREEYLRRTLVKAKQFKVLSAFLTGRRQKFEDAIKAGGNPPLDYSLTPAVLQQLQQIQIDGMTLPMDQLRTL